MEILTMPQSLQWPIKHVLGTEISEQRSSQAVSEHRPSNNTLQSASTIHDCDVYKLLEAPRNHSSQQKSALDDNTISFQENSHSLNEDVPQDSERSNPTENLPGYSYQLQRFLEEPQFHLPIYLLFQAQGGTNIFPELISSIRSDSKAMDNESYTSPQSHWSLQVQGRSVSSIDGISHVSISIQHSH
ncbi:hypothetical protein FH972_022991 [Carpinus fangiana]|uniref:Uncharacterized protein n=1 Tax=Carpinus fangiana TaxID=176857 RepID=A0A5N6KTW5_9ROSI|nr:hypothetical protein FH972_022991 [Carpinus fangiana]